MSLNFKAFTNEIKSLLIPWTKHRSSEEALEDIVVSMVRVDSLVIWGTGRYGCVCDHSRFSSLFFYSSFFKSFFFFGQTQRKIRVQWLDHWRCGSYFQWPQSGRDRPDWEGRCVQWFYISCPRQGSDGLFVLVSDDHSRIVLQKEDVYGDYINASLVEVPEAGRKYILTQVGWFDISQDGSEWIEWLMIVSDHKWLFFFISFFSFFFWFFFFFWLQVDIYLENLVLVLGRTIHISFFLLFCLFLHAECVVGPFLHPHQQELKLGAALSGQGCCAQEAFLASLWPHSCLVNTTSKKWTPGK